MTPMPRELVPLFFPPGSPWPALFLATPAEAALAAPIPDTVRCRYRHYAPLFTAAEQVEEPGILLAALPSGLTRLPSPLWLAALLGENTVPDLPAAFYRLTVTRLPALEYWLEGDATMPLSSLFGRLLSQGALTPDMLLGLLARPGMDRFRQALSPRVRDDMEAMRTARGTPDEEWAALAALLFRINAVGLDREDPSGPWQILWNVARALLAGQLSGQPSPAQSLAALEHGPEILSASGNELLATAFAPCAGETLRLFTALFPARKLERLRAACAAVPHDPLAALLARFTILSRIRRRQATLRPFFNRDLAAFLRRERTAASRRFLLLEAGIGKLTSGLAAMSGEVREAFLESCDQELMQLACAFFSGKIVLQTAVRGREALDTLATEWRMLELAGLWGIKDRSAAPHRRQ